MCYHTATLHSNSSNTLQTMLESNIHAWLQACKLHDAIICATKHTQDVANMPRGLSAVQIV